MTTQPKLKEEFLKYERQRWRQKVKEGKIKQRKDLSEREQRKRRKNWKQNQRESSKLQQSESYNNAKKENSKLKKQKWCVKLLLILLRSFSKIFIFLRNFCRM